MSPQITDKQYTYNTFSMKSLLLSIAISLFCFYSNAGTRIVTNTNDTGTGSLRAEIDSAQEGDTIRFSSSLIASGTDSIVFHQSLLEKLNQELLQNPVNLQTPYYKPKY